MKKENWLVRFTNYGDTFTAEFSNGCTLDGRSNSLPLSLSNLKSWHLASGLAELYSVELDDGNIEYDVDVSIDHYKAEFYDKYDNLLAVCTDDEDKFYYLIDGLETVSLSDFAHDIEGE